MRQSGSSPRVRGKAPGGEEDRRPPRIIPAGAGKRASGSGRASPWRDHPRGCGEKWGLVLGVSGVLGSSPRVRGKGSIRKRQTLSFGIIPAGAGKRPRTHRAPRRDGDHPRGCGEKSQKGTKPLAISGSSPRVRGKDFRDYRDAMRTGIIPAGAGKSLAFVSCGGSQGDHPRGCGEKAGQSLALLREQGSSPRVRGKGDARGGTRYTERIIPAGAGKSSQGRTVSRARRDHPRGCGEKAKGPRCRASSWGSSPRVRGKACAAVALAAALGIIPAGAGKSAPVVATWRKIQDHPRGCGEKGGKTAPVVAVAGSSPRVRGKALQLPPPPLRGGIIPAGAGKSHAHAVDVALDRDHPRGCGEKDHMIRLGRDWRGSSPRVRGKET